MVCHSAPDWLRLIGIPLSGGQLFDGSQQQEAEPETTGLCPLTYVNL